MAKLFASISLVSLALLVLTGIRQAAERNYRQFMEVIKSSIAAARTTLPFPTGSKLFEWFFA